MMTEDDIFLVFKSVAEKLDVPLKSLFGRGRHRELAEARCIGIRICVDRINKNSCEDFMKGSTLISSVINRDHATINYHAKHFDTLMRYAGFKAKYEMCAKVDTKLKRDEFLVDA